MKPITFALTLLLLSECKTNPDQCNCKSTFDWMTETFMENDAGYRTLVEFNNLDGVKNHTKALRRRAKRTRHIRECEALMNEWLHFFRKEHIGIYAKSHSLGRQHNTSSKPNNRSTQLKALNDKTLYLKIFSFEYQYKDQIDNLIKQNELLLTSFPNLIIDIRGSGGGSDASFQGLLPFIYTNSMRWYGDEFYASEQNTIFFEQYAGKRSDKSLLEMAKKMRNTQGEFVIFNDPVMTASFDTVMPYPKRIGIICDRYNGSSDESFLVLARQSQKVKIFGEPTGGAFDYANMNSIKSPDENFELWYAMSRSTIRNEYPIDGIGIQPDFYLDRFLEEDWIEYTRSILEQQ
ncbi:S41 family peptidase [Natronoflexus pectinivorans]|uniref:Peptidase S41-like protein n=1 Tax=Natronoflexus pectinivorans TaxID=682526 RepID=A0A4R2GNL8_9BACT|nr:S41 family peptidase [Natronoflexus pectinivorans]TCO10598.1 peptidase S41-like protein [Natronoflexus pectinivorans]